MNLYIMTAVLAVFAGCAQEAQLRGTHGNDDEKVESAASAVAGSGGLVEAATASVPVKSMKVRFHDGESRVFVQRNAKDEAAVQVQLPDLDFDYAYGRVFRNGKEGAKFDVSEKRGKYTTVTVKKGIENRIKIYLHLDGKYVARADSPEIVVGDLFIVAGQSNSANAGRGKTKSSSAGAFMYTGSTYKAAEDPYYTTEDGSTGSSPWPNFSDFYYQGTGVPVAVYSLGHGQTYAWEWQPGGTLYPRLERAVKKFGKKGFRAMLWHQGESDVWAGTRYNTYFNYMSNLIWSLRGTIGWNEMPFFVARTSYTGKWGYGELCKSLGGYPKCVNQISDRQNHVLTGQSATWSIPNVFPGSNTDALWEDKYRFMDGSDVHMSELGQYHHGWRWYDAVKKSLPAIK